MLLTEEQARKKRCPMPMGTMDDQQTQKHCIASECMAWREGVYDHQRNLNPADRTWGVGYCGAFGRAS